MSKIGNFFRTLVTINVLDDIVYPALLDRFGHKTARRVVSAIALLGLLTVLIPFTIAIWLYNTVMDLVFNAGGGWVAAMRDQLTGLIHGTFQPGEDEDDE